MNMILMTNDNNDNDVDGDDDDDYDDDYYDDYDDDYDNDYDNFSSNELPGHRAQRGLQCLWKKTEDNQRK